MFGLVPLRHCQAAIALQLMRKAAFVVMLFAVPVVVFASPLGSGVASGLADSHAVDLGTAYSMAWNPATLGMQKQNVQVALTPVTVRVVADQAEISPLLRYLFAPQNGHEDWSVPKIESDFLDLSVESGHRVQIGVGQRGVAMGVEARALGTFTRDFVELLGQRGPLDKSYHIAGSTLDWSAYISLGASSAFPIVRDRFFVGATAKALDGWSYGDMWVEGSTVHSERMDETARIHSVMATRGHGFALDVGAAWRVTDTVTADVSWLNIGYIVWADPVLSVMAVEHDGAESFLNTVEESKMGPLKWRTPETVRIGIGVEANPQVYWALNVERSLAAEPGEIRFSVGAETTRIPLFPLRFGVRYSTATEQFIFATGLGLHLGPLTVDVGIPNVSALLNGGREAGIALSTGIKF